ncbi:MAG: GAF domain-containing protein [Deltaproteobacteria bacterium]|nr:GAF domain-containing protein [Deltaproteobacteria bacterium]
MLNVNKLFRRLTIRSKLVIAFVLLGVIPLLVVGGYGAFYSFSLHVILVVGGLVLAIATTVGITAASHFTKPILELNRGAEIVAAGNFNYSIKVETNDEIEDLTHSFNLMTQKLKEHEEQLRAAHERLEMKAREAEALYRLGTEISAFLDLDKILHLVAEKAQELLGSDVAALCLLDEHGKELVAAATSGPANAFSLGRARSVADLLDHTRPCNPPKADGEQKQCTCHMIRDEYHKAHLAVPLKTRDKVIGALCVGTRASREFIKEDIDLLSGLASQAAIAIENARLHKKVRSLAALEERERISKDLHDGIIQSIYATGLGLEDNIQLIDEDPAKAKQRLEQAIEDLNDVIKDVRNYIFNLQPEVLHGKQIGQALDDLVRGLKINSLIDAELVVGEGVGELLSQEQKTHLFQIAREALANVAKHAEASKVRLELLRATDGLTFSIEDNGVGLDAERARTAGQGLRNIGERAKLLGGDFEIKSGVRRGTCLAVTIPVGESKGDGR